MTAAAGTWATARIDKAGAVDLSGCAGPVPWWSFTKTVLATAILRLVDQGALGLAEHLDGQPFTVRQLLRHESGLPDYGVLGRYHEDVAAGRPPWPVSRLLDAVDADRLRFEPGTGWAYSNIGYLRLARLIEQVTGRTLAVALGMLVFRPCGLATARLATSPSDLSEVRMGSTRSYHPGWVYHGLVVGTAADAARLLRAVVMGGLVRPQTLTDMMEGRPLPHHRSALHPDPAYGLGLMLSASDPQDHPIGHGGEGPGSRIAVYAHRGAVAAVWTALPCVQDADIVVRSLLT